MGAEEYSVASPVETVSLIISMRHSLCAARVSSRICSPEQSPSPSHTPHRSKVIFAEFVNLSSESRVLSPRQGKSMASLNSSASSSQCPSNGGHPTDSNHPPLSCPTERVPYPLATTTPRPGYGSAPLTGVAPGISPSLIHFPDVSSAAACPIQSVDVHEPVDKWKHCLVGYVAGKFPGYSAMQSYINRTWQHEVHFSMHDSGWLLFDFSSEITTLDVLGSGPYAIFGRPIVLQIMPEFFDFQFTEITSMPTWVRFPNLPLRCWNNICLTKIASMVGKPIHCDGPTAQMTRISYARVLIEIDLLSELKTSVNVLLPNGTLLVQHLVYESLPRFCKHCKSLGHSMLTCNKGHIRTRKRLHATSTRSASTSTSAETAAVEKQSPYCAGPSCNFREDPVSSEAAVMALQPSSSQPPDCKSTKADTSVLVALGQKPNTHKIPRRQYLTRSKAAASSYEGPITVSVSQAMDGSLFAFILGLVLLLLYAECFVPRSHTGFVLLLPQSIGMAGGVWLFGWLLCMKDVHAMRL
ncbi:hypothetical protein NC653_029241 [Populus alba x Populus x berolinensis]|uniref:DUF4283 domain-containing protein n=1 Tax=Populus alba x Populus x berolinensis TaxID=444605 RepID=A0AAD6M1K2_9ROSI|nr:hypothetical protein NC653_029241 [Populus alba x Populus x berolinensis]